MDRDVFHSKSRNGCHNRRCNREFDVVIWGATGFTGRLVAEYYAHHYRATNRFRWAIAGRSRSKLEKLRRYLLDDSLSIIVSDSFDSQSLESMAARTQVICSTVGPYALYGDALVAACVNTGTDYCDLAGEAQWIRRVIDRHHEAAEAAGAKIVHSCGFDSIPSDLGVLYFQREAFAREGAYLGEIKMRLKAMRGSLSGGTYASMKRILHEAEKDRSIYKTLFNPYGLNPVGEESGADLPDLRGVKYDKDFGNWIAPFIMAAINTKVVRRSHALRGYCFGKDFRYDEASISGVGLLGRLKGLAGLMVLGALTSGKTDSLFKRCLNRVLPKPGEGPSRMKREAGFFSFSLYGRYKDGRSLRATVTGDRDPRYGSTSKMLGESAICLALDREKLPQRFGVLTPASAMEEALLDRLQANAGVHFSIQA